MAYATDNDPDEDKTVALPLIAGRYRVVRSLGCGAFGEVVNAWDQHLGRTVAIKLLKNVDAATENARARFLREMRILARLDHPNIVTLFDAQAAGDRSHGPFLVMKLVDGTSLAGLIRQGRVEEREALHILQQSASALSYAHSHDVLHRDLKPSNILLGPERQAYLVDFGLATLSTAPTSSITDDGTIVGTPRYMAPEMLDGIYTHKGDLYALGATLYEMLFGEPCFSTENRRALFIMIAKEDPPLLADPPVKISTDTHDLLKSLLRKEPSRRPDSAQAVADYLAVLLSASDPTSVSLPPLAAESYDLSRIDTLIETMASHNERIVALSEDPSENLDRILTHLSDAIGLGNASLRGVARHESDEEVGHLYPRALTLLQIAESIETSIDRLAQESEAATTSVDALLLQFHFNVLSPLGGLLEKLEKEREEEVSPREGEFFSFDAEDEADEAPREDDWIDDLLSTLELRRHDAYLQVVGAGRDAFLREIKGCSANRRQALVEGAWAGSDVLLSRGRSRSKAVFETILALDLDEATQGKWRTLYSLFRKPSRSGYWDPETVSEMIAGYPEEDRRTMAKALLFHPSLDYRRLALAHLKPHDFWWLLADESVPFHWVLEVWRHLRPSVDIHFLKIAFVSLRGRLLATRDEEGVDVGSMLALLKEFYLIGSFHETAFFNMLTDLHEVLRTTFKRHQSLFDFDQEYVEKFARFLKGPSRPDQPVEGWGRVPLPVQRLLARRGHFQKHFACHPIDPIALECLKHIAARENIADFLELYAINGALLQELTKETRFFREEQCKYLLVSNPKAPAVIVARYLAFLRTDNLKKIATSHNCNQVARALAEKILKRRRK